MTGIQPVNTWVEVEVFFESITDADRQWCEPGIRCGERRRARAGNKAAVESIEDGHNGSQAPTPVGRVDANGHGRRSIRFARLAVELMAAAAPARSSMSGASWWATAEAERGPSPSDAREKMVGNMIELQSPIASKDHPDTRPVV